MAECVGSTDRISILTGDNWSTWRRTFLSTTLSNRNPTRTGLGLNLELRGERPETNRPSHANASDGRSGEWRRRLLQYVSWFLPDSTELITRQNIFQSHDRENQM